MLSKAMKRPSAEIAGELPPAFDRAGQSTLTRTVVPATRSRTKTSAAPLVSFDDRFSPSNATRGRRPIEGDVPPWFPIAPDRRR
jgi:hypothetical protein